MSDTHDYDGTSKPRERAERDDFNVDVARQLAEKRRAALATWLPGEREALFAARWKRSVERAEEVLEVAELIQRHGVPQKGDLARDALAQHIALLFFKKP